MEDRSKPIIVSEDFNVTTVTVWSAITQVEQMREWFFENIPDFKPQVGFKTSFPVQSTNREFIHVWKIVEVIPERKITYDWSYENIEGSGNVIFELFDIKGGCQLTLTNTGLDSFPDNIPEFNRQSCLDGWNYFIKDRLSNYLKSKN